MAVLSTAVAESLSDALSELARAGLAGTFLGDLDPGALLSLLLFASIIEVGRREAVFPGTPHPSRVGIVLEGTVRTYLTGPDGRQVTIRYARAGAMVGTATGFAGDQLPISSAAVTPCALIEVDMPRFTEMLRTVPSVARAAATETSRRLEQVFRTSAALAFATVRERVATHLLEMGETPAGGGLVVRVTQQELAEALGTTREVVARSLRELRAEGVILTGRGGVRVLEPRRLSAIAGRWWTPTPLYAIDPDVGPEILFAGSPHPVIGVDDRGDIVFVNDRIEPALGWQRQSILGRPIERLLSESTASEVRTALGSAAAAAARGPIGLGRDPRATRADGTTFPAEITLLPGPAVARPITFVTIVDVSYRDTIRRLVAGISEASGQARSAARS